MLDLKDIPSPSITTAGKALAEKLVTEAELLRLKAIAHLQARGLPPEISWSDLLQEAFARILDGSRRRPPGLPMVNFVAGIMRSIRSQVWERTRREAARLPHVENSDADAPDPERSLVAVQELAAIMHLSQTHAARAELIDADDDELVQVIAELGLKPSMKGSVALFGVTRDVAHWALRDRSAPHAGPAKSKRAAERRRPKGSSRGEL